MVLSALFRRENLPLFAFFISSCLRKPLSTAWKGSAGIKKTKAALKAVRNRNAPRETENLIEQTLFSMNGYQPTTFGDSFLTKVIPDPCSDEAFQHLYIISPARLDSGKEKFTPPDVWKHDRSNFSPNTEKFDAEDLELLSDDSLAALTFLPQFMQTPAGKPGIPYLAGVGGMWSASVTAGADHFITADVNGLSVLQKLLRVLPSE